MTEYLGVWCPTCQQDCIPIHGLCGFCDTPVDENAPNQRQRGATVNICKVDGCTNEPAGKGGPWKGMCDQHISAEMARRHAKRRANAPAATKPAKTNGHHTTTPVPMLSLSTRAGRVQELAERLDALRIEIESVQEAFNAALEELAEAATGAGPKTSRSHRKETDPSSALSP